MHRLALLLLALLLAVPAAATEIKLSTWNIAWLTLRPPGDPALPRDLRARQPGDWELLRGYASRLGADVVALQEIDTEEAAYRLFDRRDWAVHLTAERDVQRPGFAVRRTLRLVPQRDLAELDLHAGSRRSLRRGADAIVEAPSGARLRLLSVHLDAGCRDDPLSEPTRDCENLRRQAEILAGWAAARQREGVAFAILGDFNRRMGERDDFLRTLEAAAPLTRPTAGLASPCWADARGGRPFISHLLFGGPARDWVVERSLSVMVYAERDRSFRGRLSDHCPVSVRLRLP
jgi:endonuclease/exonuclease/phosphatase family metal-dependent hydrolase